MSRYSFSVHMMRSLSLPCLLTSALVAALPATFSAFPAHAELQSCQTSIRGQQNQFVFDADNPQVKESLSLREKIFGSRGKVTCPGQVTLRAMTPELDDQGRAPFCLQWDKDEDTYIGYAQGERDGFGHCIEASKSFCERVNGSGDAAKQMTENTNGFAKDVTGKVVGKKIGSVVVKTTGDKLKGRLKDAGVAAIAAASPAGLAAVAVTAVAVGGTMYVCSDKGAKGADVEGTTNQLPDGANVDATVNANDGAELLGSELPVFTDPEAVTPPVTQPVEEAPLNAINPETGIGVQGAAEDDVSNKNKH
ncbi:hypothetical protein [Thioclava sp. GXIMD4216]|uniref:hypothetical protein n=1 Tax=Thioclava sp. GXIMD4216 TaxID=3131929 RepID=UPI0030D4C542